VVDLPHQIQDAAKNDPAIHLFTNLTGVGNIEINAFQRLSDVVIQKSIREGFGLVVSEALWKETPVVAGRAGGIPLQMRDGAGGFLIDSVEECARKTLRLLKDPEEGQQLARNGQELVRERFLLTRLIGDEHLGSLPHGARVRPGGVGNIDPQTVTSYQPHCRDRQLLPSTGSPAAIHVFLPRRTPTRLRSPWPPAHGRSARKWVTPRPSSRALSPPPCRGASRAPSWRPCRAVQRSWQVRVPVLGGLCGQSADHGCAAGLAQHKRRQMVEGAANSGAPEDDIGTKNGTVGPADAIFEDLAELHPTHMVPSPRRQSFSRICRL
jgi:hypothetical protein